MTRNVCFGSALFAFAVIALVGAPAGAALVSPSKANGTFIAGSGIPGNNFTVATAGSGDAVALKGRQRDTGQPLSQSGNIYYVSTGLAADNTNPAWSFDYQFSPKDSASTPSLFSPSAYWLTLEVDFDPAYGATDFKTLSGRAGTLTTGYKTNPGSNAWSSNATPWVVSESTNSGFSFWALAAPIGPTGFDPSLPGEYEIRLTVSSVVGSGLSASRGADIVSTDILVRAIPEPASAGLASLAALGFFVVRRRQR